MISTRARSSSSRGALPSELFGESGGGIFAAAVVIGGGEVIVVLIFHRLFRRAASLLSLSSSTKIKSITSDCYEVKEKNEDEEKEKEASIGGSVSTCLRKSTQRGGCGDI